MDRDSKLLITWMIGGQDPHTAEAFMEDVEDRLSSRAQLSTDGNMNYPVAVDKAFGGRID